MIEFIISLLPKTLMYSTTVWGKCGHYPSIRSHIVVPLGSIHPSKVYSWGQASAAYIINRTELSAVLRIWLHLASCFRFDAACGTLWVLKQPNEIKAPRCLSNVTPNHEKTTADLGIGSSSPLTARRETRSLEIVFALLQLKGRFIDLQFTLQWPAIFPGAAGADVTERIKK